MSLTFLRRMGEQGCKDKTWFGLVRDLGGLGSILAVGAIIVTYGSIPGAVAEHDKDIRIIKETGGMAFQMFMSSESAKELANSAKHEKYDVALQDLREFRAEVLQRLISIQRSIDNFEAKATYAPYGTKGQQ